MAKSTLLYLGQNGGHKSQFYDSIVSKFSFLFYVFKTLKKFRVPSYKREEKNHRKRICFWTLGTFPGIILRADQSEFFLCHKINYQNRTCPATLYKASKYQYNDQF